MSEKRKKGIKAVAATCVAAALLALLTFLAYEEAHRVRFADKYMGNVITKSSGTGKKPEDFQVEDLAKVEELLLGLPFHYETLSDIERCTNLKRLEIGIRESLGGSVKEEDILGEEGIVRLERELEGILESCGQLKYLYIYNGYGTCNLSSLGFLEKGKNLERLTLFYMGNLDYSSVFSCSELRGLSLMYCSVADLDIREIGRIKNLEYLSLAGTDITEMGSIAELNNLKILDLSRTDITEVENIRELQNLEDLYLNNTGITEMGSIVELENLDTLYLSKTDITEMENIGKLEKLRILYLDNTGITEAGELVNLKNLKVLDITDTPLAGNEEELRLLKEALPDTKIVTDSIRW